MAPKVSPDASYPVVESLSSDVAAAAAALRLRRHTTRRLAVGAAGGQQVAGGVQPPQPGHAQASGGAGDAPGAGDGRSVENFIPLRYPDLRDRLVDAYPEFFADAAVKAQFYALAERLSLRNLIELTRAFRPLSERYAFLDPDELESGLPALTGSSLSREERIILAEEFESGIHQLLLHGGFEEVSEEQLAAAMNTVGLSNGLAVTPPNPEAVRYKLYFRGTRMQKIEYRSWRTLWCTRRARVPVFGRLALVFRARSEADAAALDDEAAGSSWLRRTLASNPLRHRVIKVAETPVSANHVYLKLFRDIEVNDTDMLLPGSVARFSWWDWIMIAGPVVFGLVSAIIKSARGSLNFVGIDNIISSCLLVILPLTWALRGYLAVSEKQRLYAAHMNRVFLLHCLNCNGGVVTTSLDEAREQADNECLLAFLHLWRGQASPAPRGARDLDAAVEAWVNGLVAAGAHSGKHGGGKAAAGGGLHIDFQVKDAVAKLVAMGLVRESDGGATLTALGLEAALEAAALSNIAPSGGGGAQRRPEAGGGAGGGGSSGAHFPQLAGGGGASISWPAGGGGASGGEGCASGAYPQVCGLGDADGYWSPVATAKRVAAEREAARAAAAAAVHTGPGWDDGGGAHAAQRARAQLPGVAQ